MPGSKKVWLVSLLCLAVFCPRLPAQESASPEARAAHLIALKSRVLDTSRPEPVLPEVLRALPADATADEVVLVKFPGPVTARQVQALRAASLQVYTYLPYYSYLVKMPAGARTKSLLSSLGASWLGPYHPAYKISPEIAAVGAEDSDATVKSSRPVLPVMIHVLPDADLSEVMRTMKDLGVKGIVGSRRDSHFSRVRLLLTPAEIAALREPLAALRDVFWIDLEGRKALRNDTTVWVGQSGLAGGQTTPIFSQGIFGEGQVVGIIDTGLDADMCFFRDTALGLPPTNLCNGGTVVNTAQRKVLAVDFLSSSECAGGIATNEWDTQGHGSHVAGTVAGDNFAHLLTHDTADGMAPGAKLVFQDAGFLTDNCGDLPGIGCPVVDLKPIFLQAYNQGARLHTNSWGDNENAAVQNNYTAASQDADQVMWDHKDFLIFYAAGNAGPGAGSVGSPSTNKNGVSVGATLRGTSADSMASFSSCGPTADGRIKPDITVPGSSIVSAGADRSITSNNCGTATMSGTSMASPGATGLTALIRQYFTDGWYPTGAKNSANGFTPSAALLKATLVNSAVSMASSTAIPANCQGWGRVLLENALFFTGQTRKLSAKDTATPFATGSTNEDRTFTYSVTAGESFKATLAWTDFPSTPAASVNLNNDLDLIVTGPTGTVWRGNVFSGGVSATGGTADRRNTLEQVLLAAPAAGVYTVTVRSFNVPSGPQPFALVVTGNAVEGGTPPPPPVTVFFDDFETSKGWTTNPAGTDTATTGQWERGVPQATNSGGAKQLATTVSGTNDLVTGRLAGTAAGDFDVDGGTTSIQSPAIVLPASGTLTLSFSYYFAHGTNSSTADFFRVKVVGTTTTTVLQELGSTANDNAVWATSSVNISSFAGQTVRILIETADASTASLVEAAVDDV
ncbi:MAG TPA: S8 family serine peptidase, partial [Thermoanaerobaculia bacterium]|nr:S8 family serine peptidase [Thermoanaerobaculia bacterium]